MTEKIVKSSYLAPNGNRYENKAEYLKYLEDCASRWELLHEDEQAMMVRAYAKRIKDLG